MLGAQGSNHGGEPQAAAANPGSSAGHTVQVRPGLYLGGAAALAEPDRLMEAGITAVLTVDSEPGFQAGAGFEGLRSLFVPALDEPETDLLSHLDRCAAFIGQSRAEGRAVLVHWNPWWLWSSFPKLKDQLSPFKAGMEQPLIWCRFLLALSLQCSARSCLRVVSRLSPLTKLT